MPKDMYRPSHSSDTICSVTFCVDSPENMQKLARVHVFQTVMYNDQGTRVPASCGVLDKKMGTISNAERCETCGNTLDECSGHYGYLDLELPVFHYGYFKHILHILKCICKTCSKILLNENTKDKFRKRFTKPNLSYTMKKKLRDKVSKLCVTVKECPSCGALNGTVKQVKYSKESGSTSVLKIVHVVSKGNEKKATMIEEVGRLQNCVASNPILSGFEVNTVTENLTPVDVQDLFKKIPIDDYCVLGMNAERAKPENLIWTRMLVPPRVIRPSVISELKAGTNEDDLSLKQVEILKTNSIIRGNMERGEKLSMFVMGWDYLTLQTALYINGEISGYPDAKKKPSRGLVQRLKGKQGRFRGNLSGKRVDFTARTVISPDPYLEIDQVGVPKHIAKILTFPEKVFTHNMELIRSLVMNGPDKWPGANYIEQKNGVKKSLRFGNREKIAHELRIGDTVERHLMDDDIVLFNRQPSLHRLSIMSHRAKVHDHRTLRFNECCCNPYNADFDGDEMNLHLPQTLEAKAEASILMGNKHNLVTPRNGDLLIAAIQDFITGAYLLTRKDVFLNMKVARTLASALLSGQDSSIDIKLPYPCIMKPNYLWSGKQIFSLIFKPNKKNSVEANLIAPGKDKNFSANDSYVLIRNSELLAGAMTKANLGSGVKETNIFYIILRDYGADFAIKAMSRLARLSSAFLMYKGFSIGIEDVTPSEDLLMRRNRILNDGYTKCDELIEKFNAGKLECLPGSTAEETSETMLLKELSSVRDSCGKACLEELPSNNAALIMALSGSKGSVINIAQMVTCVAQQAVNGKRTPEGFCNRSLPHFMRNSLSPESRGFVENSFFSGLSPTELFYHTMAGREGLVDTAVKTAETGYMQRRLVKVLEDLVVSYDGTVRNAEELLLQHIYGGDGLDPTYMEGDGVPVNFERVLNHIISKHPYRDEIPFTADEMRRATSAFLKTPAFSECSDEFIKDLEEFIQKKAEKIDLIEKSYGDIKVVKEMERVTCSQLVIFFETCVQKYLKTVIEPGTAVGGLAAQSLGEPGTQMTLKTFHFAGVASMNITQGVPRLQEIMNASTNISTPIVRACIEDATQFASADRVRRRIIKTHLNQITMKISIIIESEEEYIEIILDGNLMRTLEINVEMVKYSICTAKLKVKEQDVVIKKQNVIHIYPRVIKSRKLNFVTTDLLIALPKVTVKGYPSINRVVVDDSSGEYSLCVEGNNLLQVMATYGVVGTKTKSNNIMEVYKTLGVEAARETIVKEIISVMDSHGIKIDKRHVMLLADIMTPTGEVLGITRTGLANMKESVFNLASFEMTAHHLFDAAFYGQKDKLNGVSESIIFGTQTPIGTGTFKMVNKREFRMPQTEEDYFSFIS